LRKIALLAVLVCGLAGCQSGRKTTQALPDKTGLAAESTTRPANFQLFAQARPPSHLIAAGTPIPVRLQSTIDSSDPDIGYPVGITDAPVMGADGKLAIPAGSAVTLAIREANKRGGISVLKLGLYSINIAGLGCLMSDGRTEAARLDYTEDAGRGAAHMTVHLDYGSVVEFRLERSAQCE
jgi:hypothetical protein